jgi:hypothetical protein
MKRLRAIKLDDIVTVSFENKEGHECNVMLRKLNERWTCPVMAYTKVIDRKFTSVYGLPQGWEPTSAMIKKAERALA